MEKEQVNHPEHYGGSNNPYEAIKVIDAWDLDFYLGKTVKGEIHLMTAMQIKHYIEKNSEFKITNIKYFGRELKLFFGKSIQKRGFGFVYHVVKKQLQ